MAVQKREFEGVEHIDAVRLSTRRERRKGLIEKLRDNHNEPGEVLKPYITMAVLALLLSWAPFWPELLLVLTVFMALGFPEGTAIGRWEEMARTQRRSTGTSIAKLVADEIMQYEMANTMKVAAE